MIEHPKRAEIHRFGINGKRIVFSVKSLIFFELSDIAEYVLKLCDGTHIDVIVAELEPKYPKEDILTTLNELKKVGAIIKADYQNPPYSIPDTYPVSALALHVCHDCNLACKYCYGDGGTYGGPRTYMSQEVAEKAINLLLENSPKAKEHIIIFFGGEPLLNFELIRHVLEYTKNKRKGEKLRFTMTTNGTLFSKEIIEYLNKENIGVMISMDGPKEIQDDLRPCLGGGGSYDLMLPGVQEFLRSRGGNVSVRATYTPKELTLSRITDHLFEFGFKRVSLSPATEFKEKKFSLKREHISVIKDEERKIAEDFLKKVKERDYRGLSLFDYQLSQMYHRRKRIYPCGGGKNYFGVSPEGNIYLCHRFVGMEEFKMGNVFTGLDKSLQKEILAKHVDERKICKSCWARYLCGGGCYYHALAANGNIFTPDPIMCVLTKHSLEVSMWIYAQIHDEDKDILRNIYENLSEPYRDGSASGIIEKDERKEKG